MQRLSQIGNPESCREGEAYFKSVALGQASVLGKYSTRDEGEIWIALYFLIGRHFHDKALADR